MLQIVKPIQLLAMVALVLIFCGSPCGRAADLPSAVELAKKLREVRKFKGFDDPRTTLEEALQVFGAYLDVSFDVQEKAFAATDVKGVLKTLIADPNPIPPFTGTLAQMLDKLLAHLPESAHVVYIVRGHNIEFTTREAVRREFYPDRPKKSFLPPLVNASVADVPLNSALHQLANESDANIVVDPRAQKESQKLVTAGFTNVPLDTATRILADMAGLTVVEVGNVLYVTTPEHGKALQQEQEKRSLRGRKKSEPPK